MKCRSSPGNPRCCVWAVHAAAFCWLMMSCPSPAATYYVDANDPGARDSNPGTESLPFKTIGKAASLVNPGDTVLIKEGVYRETLTLSRSGVFSTHVGRWGTTTTDLPITFEAYPGHEGKAIINAAEPVTDWRRCTGPQECAGNPNWERIYWADVSVWVWSHPDSAFAVRQVFQHGQPLPRSRYPNTGWRYPTSTPDPMRIFVDGDLSKPSGYFSGAVCHIKTQVWQMDQIPIASFSRKTVTLSESPRFAITPRFGYYITSVVGEINEQGEWAYDPAQRRIYLWPQGDGPEGVEFSYRPHCVTSYNGTAWNVVRGLTLRYAYRDSVFLYRSHHMRIEDNTIEHAYGLGVYVYAGEGATGDYNQIVHNTIRHSAFRGLSVDIACSYTRVEGNTVYATGTDTFGGDLMHGDGCGVYISGPYTQVYNNRIDGTGSAGLYMDGKTLRREVSYNYITNTALSISDTGGLYTGGFSDVPEKDYIHHNLFVDAIGCVAMDRSYDTGLAPTRSTHSGLTSGIYVDEEGNNRIIEDNTVIGSTMAGILFHWAPSNLVRRNTLYGNREAQVYFNGHDEDRKRLLDDILVDNILFATAAQQYTLWVGMNYDGVHFGQSDRNYLYNPYDSRHIFVSWVDPSNGVRTTEDLSLDGWRALSGYDLQSRDFSPLEHWNGISLASPRKSRIVYNPTLEVAVVDLEGNLYCDVQGNPVSGAVTLQPFESKVLVALDPNVPPSSLP